MDDSGKFEQSYDYRSSGFENSANFPNNNNNEKSMESYNRFADKSADRKTEGLVSSYVKSFELGRVKWRGPLADNYLNKSSSNDRQINYRQIDDRADLENRLTSHSGNSEEPARLIKVREGNVSTSAKMFARLTNVENRFDETIAGPNTSQMSSMHSLSSLSAVIDDLDAQIKALEIEEANEAANAATASATMIGKFERIYPVIEDMNFEPTGWTPRKGDDSREKTFEIAETARYKSKNDRVTDFFGRGGDRQNSGSFVEDNFKDDDSRAKVCEIIEPSYNHKSKNDRVTDFSRRIHDRQNSGSLVEDNSKDDDSREKKFQITETANYNHKSKADRVTDFSPEDRKNSATFVKDNSDEIEMYETPKKKTRKVPLMESTRKSPHSDSTRIKFPTPTRVESTISTIEGQLTPRGDDRDRRDDERSQQAISAATTDPTTPFEVERFLQDALGDELYNTSVTFDASEVKDTTTSRLDASDLVSRDATPMRRRVMHALHPPATDPTSTSSNTLNRSIGIYRSLSQRIKKKFRSVLKTREESPSPPRVSRDDREADAIGQLLREVSVQQTLMNQASKALNVCHTMKEFMESSERVESDRLLLVAGLRRTAALEEIKRISSHNNRQDEEFLGARGEITLKDMSLNLRDSLKVEPREGETVEWFVVIVSQGLKVWATRAVSCPIGKPRIDFPEIVSIPNLTPNFKILVQVYSLKLRSATYNHEDKYRIRRHKRSTSCPPFLVSPTKFLRKSERQMSPKLHRSNAAKSGCTCFVLSGFVELFLHDLSLASPWPLMLVPENSILDRTIDLSLACRLHLSVSHEGFLNHGDEAGGLASWNRRWCVLKGHTLMLWNYPRDQETKEPLSVIELINCVSSKITTANRTICAKPRTLLIETARRRNATDRDSIVYECRSSCTIVRNFLSCDSVHELVEWSTKLNHVVLALREWNVIGTRPPQVSDL